MNPDDEFSLQNLVEIQEFTKYQTPVNSLPQILRFAWVAYVSQTLLLIKICLTEIALLILRMFGPALVAQWISSAHSALVAQVQFPGVDLHCSVSGNAVLAADILKNRGRLAWMLAQVNLPQQKKKNVNIQKRNNLVFSIKILFEWLSIEQKFCTWDYRRKY